MGAYPSDTKIGQSGQRLPLVELANAFQRSTQTLVAGTVTVSTGITVTADSIVLLSCNTPGGTVGYLSCPDATRVVGGPGTGEIVINSDSGSDTSTIDVLIVG